MALIFILNLCLFYGENDECLYVSYKWLRGSQFSFALEAKGLKA